MKKKLLTIFAVLGLGTSFSGFSQYCAQGPTSTFDSNIEAVTASGESSTALNYTGCPGVAGVEDQTAQSVDYLRGQSYTIDITFGTCGSNFSGAGEAWIDFNGDEVFDPVTESIGQSIGTPGTAPWDAPVTFTINVPAGAPLGATRMRVMQEEGGTPPLDPCASYSWGSVIDFTVNIVPDAPPAPTQAGGVPTCSAGSDLTLAGTPPAGIDWYWQGTDPNGTSTVDLGTDPYTVFTNGTYYARAYDPVEDVWSPSSSITVTNFVLPSDPPAPVADEDPACELSGGTDITVAAAPAGIDYYWQGTDEFGNSQADPATAPYPVTTSGTYYVAAYDPATECWSDASSITLNMITQQPNDPTVVNDNVIACSGDASIILEATATPTELVTYTIEGEDSFGDGWNGASVEIFADGVSVLVFNVPSGSFNSATFDALEGSNITTQWTTGTFDGECTYEIIDENSIVVANSAGGSEITPFTVPLNTYDINWYDAASGGNLLGSGNTLEAVGTSVMPAATSGTYEFYVEQSNGCVSNRVLVTVNVSDVNVELAVIDESCTDYQDGEIFIDNVLCGVAPFQLSIDGGSTFSNDLTGLSAGTYNVIIQDDNGDQSQPYVVEVDTAATIIPGVPQYIEEEYFACTGDASIEVEVLDPVTEDSLFTTSAGGNGCGSGNMFDLTTNTNEVTVTDLTVYPDATSSQNVTVHIKSTGGYAGSENAPGDWTLIGSYPINGVNGDPLTIDIDDFVIPSGTTYGVYVEYDAQYTNEAVGTTYSTADLTLTVGAGHCSSFSGGIAGRAFNGTIHYVASAGAGIEWFDTQTADNSQGVGNPFETVGTDVMPSAVDGTYDFYAFTSLNGCYSEDGILVQVNVAPVNVEVEGISATCNGSATGSFEVVDTLCGVDPFTYSVDGGAFDAVIPTDLLPGSHTVIVQDDNGDQTAEITFTVGDALEPSDLIMNDITDNGGQVSWNGNGDETEWNVEWGEPGFTPGTGTEIGSSVVSDTFAIITGLDSNEDYDIYVSANCGGGATPNDWAMISFTTDCGIYGLPFVETFENNSDTRVCWTNEYVDGTDDWTYQTGSSGGAVTTAYEGDLNARFVSQGGTNSPITKLVSPRFDFSGQDSVALIFAHAEEQWAGDQNETKVYTLGTSAGAVWDSIAFYNGPDGEWTVDTLFIADTTLQIAFEGINNWGRANVVDDIQMWPCTLTSGVDGEEDVCRLDGTFNLNSIVTFGEDFGRWEFPQNPMVLNDSIVTVSALPEGSFEFYYIVETPCAVDTTVATLNIFPPSSAGQNGTLNVCQNEPVNLFDGLNGNVDLGGTWYDPSNNPIAGSQPVASSIPGSFNYDYITSNGVCPADTALVEVIVASDCDYLTLGEEKLTELTVYPNPATDVINIANPSNSESLRVEILDMNGRIVLTDAKALANATEGSIDVGHLVKGVYTLRVYNEEGQKTFKVVIQ